MNNKNVKTANTEKKRMLTSRLFLSSVTKWIAITNDYSFIWNFLGFQMSNCHSSTPTGEKVKLFMIQE